MVKIKYEVWNESGESHFYLTYEEAKHHFESLNEFTGWHFCQIYEAI